MLWLWVKANGIPFWLVGAPPILVYFSWDWDVQGGYLLLTHGHITQGTLAWLDGQTFVTILPAGPSRALHLTCGCPQDWHASPRGFQDMHQEL